MSRPVRSLPVLRYACACACAAVLALLGPERVACAAQGVYAAVPLKRKESSVLIDKAAELHAQFVKRSLLVTDPAVTELVQRVGHALAPPPTDAYVDYEFYVLRDPSPNAFALPNGDIYIHSGMLARLADEGELAAVLAHEINHVAGHHSIVQYRAQGRRIWINIVVGDLASMLAELRFSRELEQEADDRAPALMVAAGYDARAMPDVLELLTRDFEGLSPRIPSVWTTHPDPEQRVASSKAVVARLPATRGGRPAEPFETIALPLGLQTVRDYIQDDYPYTAIALSETLLERRPDDVDIRMLVGDAWVALGPRSEFAPDDFTNADKRRNALRRVFRTRQERARDALDTEAGRRALTRNLNQAEKIYRGILAKHPDYAPAHRGLGEIFEARGARREAARAYLDYLKLAPDAADRPVVVARLARLRDAIRNEESDHAQE